MNVSRRGLAAAAALFVSLATLAGAQAPRVVKFPGGPDVFSVLPGRFQAFAGDIIEWHVVLDNGTGVSDVVFNYYDVMDPLNVRSCDGNPPCIGAQHMLLLCDPPYAPDPDGGSVFLCDQPTGILDIRSVTVPSGERSCVRFFTEILPGARGTAGVRNLGCVDILAPLPITTFTRPTTSSTPSCDPMPPSGNTTGCAEVMVPNVEPPDFSAVKSVEVEDVNGNGLTDPGDVMTWTVLLTNEGLEPHDGYVYDPIPPSQDFLDILDNPDAACTFRDPEIDCTVLSFAGGETKTLRFRTTLNCDVFTDDDTSQACNTAFVCTDATRGTCVPSDSDTTVPPNPTCVAVPLPDVRNFTKTWSLLQDVDGDGSLSDGDRVQFRLEVHNEGSSPATGIVVTDVLDTTCFDESTILTGGAFYTDATDTLTWLPASIAPGGFEFNEFSVIVNEAGAPCCNQASIQHAEREECLRAPLPSDDPGTPAPDDPTCVQFGPQPLIRLTKDFVLTLDADGDGEADPGDRLTFTIVIVNEGGGAATDVVVDDLLVTCWTGFTASSVVITGEGVNESTELAPPSTPNRVRVTGIGGADGLDPLGAETVTIEFTLEYQPGTLPGCCNEARATYAESPFRVDSDDPFTGFMGDATCTTRTADAATLDVVKAAVEEIADGCLQPGENVTFTITVSASDANASLIQLRDVITDPAGVFDVVNPNGGDVSADGSTIDWTSFGDVPAGGSRNIQWVGRFGCDAVSGDSATDVASAVAINAPMATSPPVVLTVSAPDLVATQSFTFVDADASGDLSGGDTWVLTVTVENTGTCAATNVTLTHQADVDLDLGTLTADGTPAIGPGGLVRWDSTTTPSLATLAPGASVTFDVRATVLDPGANPDPAKDGVVTATLEAAADSPFVVCPILERAPTLTKVIAVNNAVLTASLRLTDEDADGCHEPGEPLTVDVEVGALNGAAEGVVAVLSLLDPLGVLVVDDADGGVVAGTPPTITWDLGTLGTGETRTFTVVLRPRCDFADGDDYALRLDATSTNLATVFAELLDLQAVQPVLTATKGVTWDDADSDATLDPGETVKYEVTFRNEGTCQVRTISVLDVVDPDLDLTNVRLTPAGSDDGAGTLEWAGFGLDPGEEMAVTIEAEALDPFSNPDPNSNGFLDNEATVFAGSIHGCPAVATTARSAQLGIGVAPQWRLLRNDFITCRLDAFDTMRTFLRPRPDPEECSEPTAIDPAHRGTQIVGDATSPIFFSGDADPASSFAQCPQTLVGFGRILVFYELDDPDPICISTLRVRKSGTGVEVTW